MIKNVFKAHPIMIFRVIRPYLFILVLPLIRALVQYLTSGEVDGLLTLELFAVAFILLVAILGWRSIKITVRDNFITVQKGFLIRSSAEIELSRLSSISLKQNLFEFLIGCVSCSINTEAGRPKKSDFDIKMSIKDAKRLYDLVYSAKNMKTIRFSAYRIALLAAATSSAASGIIAVVPIINELSRLIGVAISDILLYEINIVSSKFNNIFPPVVNTLTVIILASYGVSFIIAFLKNVDFKLKSDRENIQIQSGLLVRKRVIFKKSMVNDVCFEQTALLRLFRRYSMRVSIGGYGDAKGEKAVIVPVAKHIELEKRLKKHFPAYDKGGLKISPQKSIFNLNRFLFLPYVYMVVIIGIAALLIIVFPYFDRVVILLALVAAFVDIYYASICYHDYKFGELRFARHIVASGSQKLTVREMYCNKEKVGVIKIQQTPADRQFKTCKVKIIMRSENADSVKVKNIDIKRAIRYINQSFNLNIDE